MARKLFLMQSEMDVHRKSQEPNHHPHDSLTRSRARVSGLWSPLELPLMILLMFGALVSTVLLTLDLSDSMKRMVGDTAGAQSVSATAWTDWSFNLVGVGQIVLTVIAAVAFIAGLTRVLAFWMASRQPSAARQTSVLDR